MQAKSVEIYVFDLRRLLLLFCFKRSILMVRILIAIVAVIVGLFIGGTVNLGTGMLNVLIFPMPDGVSWNDSEAINEWIKDLPQSAFILVLVAHVSQAFVGGFVAALIAKRNMMCVAMAVGVLSLAAGIINLLMIPAPSWLWVEIPLYLVAAWVAGKLVMRMRSSNSTIA